MFSSGDDEVGVGEIIGIVVVILIMICVGVDQMCCKVAEHRDFKQFFGPVHSLSDEPSDQDRAGVVKKLLDYKNDLKPKIAILEKQKSDLQEQIDAQDKNTAVGVVAVLGLEKKVAECDEQIKSVKERLHLIASTAEDAGYGHEVELCGLEKCLDVYYYASSD